MKLRTSLCNPTALKKDITRFAPAWVLYSVVLFMVLSICMADSGYYRATSVADSVSFMAGFNLCYGLINGQLLFGDLFNARHCNALHAMPLRRECWFGTHVIAGLLFSIVPNLVMSLVAMAMLGTGWAVAAWWLLAVSLQYLFFFGLAVCSALCVGNRFAMTLVYGIVNFFSVIVYWFYYSIYEPQLYGVVVSPDAFIRFCPVATMVDNYELIQVFGNENGSYVHWTYKSMELGAGWGYLAICAGLGIALLGIALLCYRRRKLESAGDFMAVRALEPVFLVLYTLSMAAFFQMFAELFNDDEAYIFLALGLIVGFFTGRMLLMRTTRVFQPRGFLWFGVLAVVFVLSLVLTALDPIGITRRIPETDQVDTVYLSDHYTPSYTDTPALTEAADIELVRQIHQLVVDGQIHEDQADPEDEAYYNYLSLYYVLDSGVTVSRRYNVAANSPAGRLAKELYSRTDYVLGTDDADAIMDRMVYAYYYDRVSDKNGEVLLDADNTAVIRGLLEAVVADCKEGNMAQSNGYHPDADRVYRFEFGIEDENRMQNYRQIIIFADCRHTIAYLEEHPFPAEDYIG